MGLVGAAETSYAYDAFGRRIDWPVLFPEDDANPFRYCGEYWDNELGCVYLRARYYEPDTGRFLSEDTHWNPGNMIYGDKPIKWNEREPDEKDPLGLIAYTLIPDIMAIQQSINLYAYCLNNPANYWDSSGLASYDNQISEPDDKGTRIVTTNIYFWFTTLTYTYSIDKTGMISFDYGENNYWSVFWRGGAGVLADAVMSAAKTINPDFLQGRSVGGIETELTAHWMVYTFNEIFGTDIYRKNAEVAQIGALYTYSTGYDSNAWVFEGFNGAFNLWNFVSNRKAIFKLLRDVWQVVR